MSTILKALRRLEEDRSLEQAPSLEEHVVGGPGEQAGSSARLKVAVIVMGGIASAAVGGLAFSLWIGGGADSPPSVAAAPNPALGVAEPAPSAASSQPSGRAAFAAAPVAPSKSAVQPQYTPERTPRSTRRPIDVAALQPKAPTPFDRPMTAPTASSPSQQSQQTREVRQAAARPPEAERVVGVGSWDAGSERDTARAFEAQDVNEAARRAAEERADQQRFDALIAGEVADSADSAVSDRAAIPPRAAPAQQTVVALRVPEPEVWAEFSEDVAVMTREEPSLPVIDDLNPKTIEQIEPESPLSVRVEEPLPVIRRARLPRVEVVQTIWHPQADRREAVLRTSDSDEVLRVSEGDAVGPLVLLQIQPAGVIFGHEGVQIQRRVGDRSGM